MRILRAYSVCKKHIYLIKPGFLMIEIMLAIALFIGVVSLITCYQSMIVRLQYDTALRARALHAVMRAIDHIQAKGSVTWVPVPHDKDIIITYRVRTDCPLFNKCDIALYGGHINDIAMIDMRAEWQDYVQKKCELCITSAVKITH